MVLAQQDPSILESLVDALPRVGIGIGILVFGFLLGRVTRRILEPRLARRRTQSFGRVISRVVGFTVVTIAVFVAATVVFPSVKPVDVLAGLGVFSIAIGFAFQDILSNLLAGILLLIRQPFESGDTIEVNDQRGVVQEINIRETQIKTFDGEKLIIPNRDVYQNVIRVQTAYGPKRTSITIGFDNWEDLDGAAKVVLDAVSRVPDVRNDPPPQAYFFEFGESTTNMHLRYWTSPEQADVRRIQDQAIRAIGRALREAEISLPSPIREIEARDSLKDLVVGRGRNAKSSNGGKP